MRFVGSISSFYQIVNAGIETGGGMKERGGAGVKSKMATVQDDIVIGVATRTEVQFDLVIEAMIYQMKV